MSEYLEFRCCMCPNTDSRESRVCPPALILHPKETPCRFVKTYVDSRGWQYKVMRGHGESHYKTRYKKPGSGGWECMANMAWRKSFDDAQSDLNRMAKLKKWDEVPVQK